MTPFVGYISTILFDVGHLFCVISKIDGEICWCIPRDHVYSPRGRGEVGRVTINKHKPLKSIPHTHVHELLFYSWPMTRRRWVVLFLFSCGHLFLQNICPVKYANIYSLPFLLDSLLLLLWCFAVTLCELIRQTFDYPMTIGMLPLSHVHQQYLHVKHSQETHAQPHAKGWTLLFDPL